MTREMNVTIPHICGICDQCRSRMKQLQAENERLKAQLCDAMNHLLRLNIIARKIVLMFDGDGDFHLPQQAIDELQRETFEMDDESV